MTYEKLFQILQGKRPMSGSLNTINYVTEEHMDQHVTVYDSNTDEYYKVSLKVSKDSDVVDDGHLLLATETAPDLSDRLNLVDEWRVEHDWA
jgi:hypothetical protein